MSEKRILPSTDDKICSGSLALSDVSERASNERARLLGRTEPAPPPMRKLTLIPINSREEIAYQIMNEFDPEVQSQ